MVISKTPFRMSFFGGGTDYKEYFEQYGGSVISTAFDKYAFVTVRDYPPFFATKNQLTYSKIERFDSYSELSHPLVRETMRYLREDRLQITYDADLPARSGIGSSSSFAVGLLNCIHSLRNVRSNAFSLANEAIYIERELCKEAGGIQDQIAAAYGGFNRIDFDKNGFYVRPIPVSPARLGELNDNLLLYFSGYGRFSGEVAVQQAGNIKKNTDTLTKIKELTEQAYRVLLSDKSMDEFGSLLHEEWRLKTSLADNISNTNIDEIYEKAVKNGALGGKLLGAGSGGFLLFYVPLKKQEAVRLALNGYMEVPFRFEPEGSRILYHQS